jgi:hypothetical protein
MGIHNAVGELVALLLGLARRVLEGGSGHRGHDGVWLELGGRRVGRRTGLELTVGTGVERVGLSVQSRGPRVALGRLLAVSSVGRLLVARVVRVLLIGILLIPAIVPTTVIVVLLTWSTLIELVGSLVVAAMLVVGVGGLVRRGSRRERRRRVPETHRSLVWGEDRSGRVESRGLCAQRCLL